MVMVLWWREQDSNLQELVGFRLRLRLTLPCDLYLIYTELKAPTAISSVYPESANMLVGLGAYLVAIPKLGCFYVLVVFLSCFI